jgi:hypothetical protein
MANNRMYLVNKVTKEVIYLAKYYPSTGWYVSSTIDEINNEFDKREKTYDTYGDEWELKYETAKNKKNELNI